MTVDSPKCGWLPVASNIKLFRHFASTRYLTYEQNNLFDTLM